MLWEYVATETLAVIPSSDDGPPAVLLNLLDVTGNMRTCKVLSHILEWEVFLNDWTEKF